ncbi:SRPBCC family protein [Tunicatimonas pelagia]|uniref:SRPBCC family protein n=1 Tax=Tunicatimonas pelagia TaxID=931531 RepID=UPI002665A94F|nr:SRPBCC family protein [Tunicatimonas pelagia]WKN43069.1 SRPBCC family protein [Tunicatimonas pelagia]
MLKINQQKNYHFSATIAVDKPLAEVWELLTDISRWKVWDTELKESYLNEAFALEATGVLIPKKGPKLKFFISELIPGQSYTFNTKMPVGYLVIKRALAYQDQVTYFTDDVQFTGALKHVFGVVLGRGFQASLPEVMENFKQLAEQHKQPTP